MVPREIPLRDFRPRLDRLWELSGAKIASIEREYDRAQGSPVFTVQGRYATRGWTEWTEGFQFGSQLLQFDATGERSLLDLARGHIFEHMPKHVSHIGVHDHGFNNVSTYGSLLRLIREGRADGQDRATCELALKVSGAVQAARWTEIGAGAGFIYSFNGPHSLFADTIRSLRSLAVAHQLGHALMGENDRRISLLRRLVIHAAATARYIVYYGNGRDAYDLRGRTAHEAIFNVTNGSYRCPSTQQGYSPFTTWTRGLAWIILGFAEELEYLDRVAEVEFERDLSDLPELLDGLGLTSTTRCAGKAAAIEFMVNAALAAADFYIDNSCLDGIPYWDTGAPGLSGLGDWRARRADPFNDFEPVDSSAAAIAAQGLLRLGAYLGGRPAAGSVSDAGRASHSAAIQGAPADARRYTSAGLTTLAALLDEPYLSTASGHQGLLLHSVYHRPNGWDYVPPGAKTPQGESSMWGDYHLREAALYLERLAADGPYLTFFLQEERQ